ncbi:MAG: tetratricopeptide repeat protein [Rhodospirillales bacterium]|nr:tetratricopeptide repeat protein [Rhodospirillales bacterium]
MSEQDAEIESLMREASALHSAGKIGLAENTYKTVLRKRRNHAGAMHLLGVITCQRGNLETGVRMIERALRVQPSFPDAYISLAAVYLNAGDAKKSLEMAEAALAQNAENPAALYAKARALIRLKDSRRVAETLARINEQKPDDPWVIKNWASAMLALDMFEDAERLFARQMQLDTDNRDAWCLRARAVKGQGRMVEALDMLNELLTIHADYVPAMIHAGDALQALGRDDEAISLFRRAVEIQPDHAEAHFNLGVALLSMGEFHDGWREYAWRFRMEAYAGFRPPIPAPVWAGEPLDGKRILLFAEQGLGDTIQFARYATPLAAGGAEVHCMCSDLLADLVATIYGLADVHGLGAAVPSFDYQISMMELPRVFDTTPATVPGKAGYIRPPVRSFDPGPGFNVGLVWQGNRAHKNDAYRSIPLERLNELLDTDGVNFVSLQFGEDAGAIRELGWESRLLDMASRIKDFTDTADIISGLDLVISVDTSVAHLAGALGTPVWVLLPTIADWRWGREGRETYWYDSMRLFRQSTLGDWSPVIDTLIDELPAVIAGKQTSRQER